MLSLELDLSCLEEGLFNIDIPSKRYNNLTNEERAVVYGLRDGFK